MTVPSINRLRLIESIEQRLKSQLTVYGETIVLAAGRRRGQGARGRGLVLYKYVALMLKNTV